MSFSSISRCTVTFVIAAGLFAATAIPVSAQFPVAEPTQLNEQLSVTANDPLYTTYAAALQRSQYTPDIGYHFDFDDPKSPVQFVSDHSGSWGMVFVQNGQIVHSPSQMIAPPLIGSSYPDLVTWEMNPFPELLTYNSFTVYNSTLSVWSSILENTSDSLITVTVSPYISENLLIDLAATTSGVSFMHEHPVDTWTLEHDIPHTFRRHDFFAMTPTPDASGVITSIDDEGIKLPEWVVPEQAPDFPVYGQLFRPDGSQIYPAETSIQTIVYLEEKPTTLISLDSPVYGHTWKQWRERGYYVLELAELPWNERAYTGKKWVETDENTVRILASEPQEGIAAVWTETYEDPRPSTRTRQDLTLVDDDLPPPPPNLKVTSDTFGIHLEWEGYPDQEYRLFWNLWKVRKSPVERSTAMPLGLDYELAQARAGRVYHKMTDISGTSYSLDLRPRVEPEEGAEKVPVAYDPGSDMFVRRFIVCPLDDEGLPGPPSLTATHWPSPTLEQFVDEQRTDREAILAPGVAMRKTITLQPGERDTIRAFRAVGISEQDIRENQWLIDHWDNSLESLVHHENGRLFEILPEITFPTREHKILYVSAFNLLRQNILPPEGQLLHNYYVFSREPTWGWGHGGQVFHESLAMLAYAHLDPKSAMESQRVFAQVQREDGYINYRTGPYLTETIPVDGEETSSAPWYAWINWEVYQITGDRGFLAEMYESSKRYYEYMLANRDSDEDGLCEWGGNAELESVRDASVAVWDQVAPADELEALDLNCMLVKEAKSLANMADELGLSYEAVQLREQAKRRTNLIRLFMWDNVTGFFYHIDGKDNDFSYEAENDLKRKEIIGFLPLWAGVANPDQAEKLVEHLTNSDEFWRKYGVPSLSADDPYYSPKGYWNGPVWIQWQYLVQRGLLDYGYEPEARELVDKVSAGMIHVLRDSKTFWEFYSPDEAWGGWHQTYIWAGLVARMMMDSY